MPSLSPRTTFLLLVGLAVVILAGGLRLARQNEVVPLERDREVQHRFAAAAQAELHRLDELYESHLARLARTVSADAFEIRREAVRLIGIRQFSLLDRTRRPGAEDINILVAPTAGERIPIPVLQMPRVGSPQDVVLMDQDKLFGSDGVRSGWIDEPGKPLIFWLRRSVNEVAVVILNTSAIDEAISQWLEQWAVKEFEPVRVAGAGFGNYSPAQEGRGGRQQTIGGWVDGVWRSGPQRGTQSEAEGRPGGNGSEGEGACSSGARGIRGEESRARSKEGWRGNAQRKEPEGAGYEAGTKGSDKL